MRKISSYVVCACIAASGSTFAADACKPAHDLKTLVPGQLTVVTMVIPPFSIPEGKGIKGVDGQIISRIAEMECLKLKPIFVDTRAVMQYVLIDKADVAVGNWFRTAARGKVMDMSEPVYIDSLGVYSKTGVKDLVQLSREDKIVGSVQGYNWTADLQKLFGNNLKLYPNPVALAQDLTSGRVDVGLDSYSSGIYAQQQGALGGYKIVHAAPTESVKASIEPAQIAFMYKKGNDQLGQAINANLKVMRDNGEVGAALEAYGLSAQDSDVGTPREIE